MWGSRGYLLQSGWSLRSHIWPYLPQILAVNSFSGLQQKSFSTHARMFASLILDRQPQLLWPHECNPAFFSRKHLLHSCPLWLLGSCNLSALVSPIILNHPRRGVTQMSRMWLSTQRSPSSVHFEQLWISAFTAVHCTNKFLWWVLKAVLIYGYRDMKLKVRCLFRKIIAVDRPLGPISFLNTGFLKRFTLPNMWSSFQLSASCSWRHICHLPSIPFWTATV